MKFGQSPIKNKQKTFREVTKMLERQHDIHNITKGTLVPLNDMLVRCSLQFVVVKQSITL